MASASGRHRKPRQGLRPLVKPLAVSAATFSATAAFATSPLAKVGPLNTDVTESENVAALGPAPAKNPVPAKNTAKEAAPANEVNGITALSLSAQSGPEVHGVAQSGTEVQGAAPALYQERAERFRASAVQAASRSGRAGLASAGSIQAGLASARTVAVQTAAAAQAAQAAAAKSFSTPVSGASFTSPFGARWGRMHAGMDLACPIGTPIRSLSGGRVTFAGSQSGYGNKIEVTLWDGTVVYYGHLSSIGVSVGERVSPGDLIGKSGNSGRSTGPHLHFEIRPRGKEPIDPVPWLKAHGIRITD